MRLIDSHAHIDLDKFDEDRDEVIERAREAHVERILNIAMGPEEEPLKRALELVERYDFIFMAAGVHPHDAARFSPGRVSLFDDVFKNPKVVAVGEIGLDFYYENSPREAQVECFDFFLDYARKKEKPVSIHSREAFDETLSATKNADIFSGPGGVMHCFTGDRKQASRFLDQGAYISLSGIVTFKKAESLKEVAKYIPLDRMLIETDCPFLAPIPHRGKRNEPSFVQFIAQAVAQERGITVDEVADATWKNAEDLFQFPT